MKKLKKISILIIILLSFFVTVSFADSGTVNVSAARLREEANTTSNIITNIYEGEKVEIIEENGDWYKVKYGSNTGYLKKEFLTVENTSSTNQVTNLEDNITTENSDNVENNTNDSINNQEDSKVVTNTATNVRLIPNMMSEISMQIEAEKELTKLAEFNNWVQVTDGIFTGWVLKNKINTSIEQSSTVPESQTTENTEQENKEDENEESKGTSSSNINKKGIINVETAKVRESASSTANVIGFLDYNDEVTISAEEGDWYKITSQDISGYVNKTLINVLDEQTVSSRSLVESRNIDDDTIADTTSNDNLTEALSAVENNSLNSQSVVDYAKQFLGYPYVVGGKNPNTGFDCSGFTRYVFLNFGYSLGSTAATQNNIGTEISRENLQPGDLILFYDEGKTKIGHTGIYIGNGDFIHAANPSRGVVIDNLNTSSYYNERFVIAKRIVE